MQRCWLLNIPVIAVGLACTQAGFSADVPSTESLHAQAVEESLQPIRPGEPGKTPFWNDFARRFIYAPAFHFERDGLGKRYRFTATAADGKQFSFEADVPWAPLTPIWKDLPVGKTHLTVQGLRNDEVISLVGERTFYRSAVFAGPYHEPAYGYEESARRALRAMYLDPHIQYWLTTGKPSPDFSLNCYPAKEMGGAVRAMTLYSSIASDPAEAEKALTIARRAADFLLSLSQPQGKPLEYFPPTYWDGVDSGPHPVHADRTMMHYPADTALAYLDLYDKSQDHKYFDAAVRIADTYKKTQSPDGTWPLVVELASGKALGPNAAVATLPIRLIDRLSAQYHVDRYNDVADRAFAWIMANPVKTFQWDGQFEDVTPTRPYVNLAREQACDVADRLMDRNSNDPKAVALAEELLRFAEDQFVVWEKPNQDWREVANLGCNEDGPATWFTPNVLEQYNCYGPVARSVGIMMNSYEKAYKVTGKPLYQAKAQSLANALTIAQKHWGGGVYPTWIRSSPGSIWDNNTAYVSMFMLQFAKQLEVPQ